MNADRAGIAASLLCAAHCALLPLLAGTGSLGLLAGSLAEDTQLELGLVVVSLVFAGWALLLGRRRHHANGPMALGVLGAVLLISAKVAAGESLELPLSLLAGGLLVSAHLLNLRASEGEEPT